MNLSGKTIGFAITGSFCTFAKIKGELMHLMEEDVNVIPIFSFNAYSLDTRFGKADEFVNAIESITKNKAIHTIAEAEKFGPKKILDILLIAPCTGNTMGKLVNGITDTPVLMAAKGHLRNQLPFYQRRIGNEFQKYRFLNEYKKPVFRSVRTGRLQTETKFTDCPHRPDHSGIGIGIRWKTNSADYPLAILKIL